MNRYGRVGHDIANADMSTLRQRTSKAENRILGTSLSNCHSGRRVVCLCHKNVCAVLA